MSSKYDPNSYRVYLSISKHKHILVEGKDDKYLIEKLCRDFLAKNNQHTTILVDVDSVETFVKGDELSEFTNNKEKVKFIANSVNGKPYSNSFIGFVDREMDKFAWDYECISELQDIINSHDIIERLVLSRGHSIENYIFDLSILCKVLEILTTTTNANQSIDLFKETFQATLRIACAVGLAATKAKVLSKVNSTIDYKLLEISSPTEVVFNFDAWVEKLVTRKISTTQEKELRLHYSVYNQQVARASISLVRWICHGHIGYDFLRALYERCILQICPSKQEETQELSQISWVPQEKIFYTFINYSIQNSLQDQCDYPKAIFELLGIG